MSRVPTTLFRARNLRSISTSALFPPAASVESPPDGEDIGGFDAHEPIVYRQHFSGIPAISKWFVRSRAEKGYHELNRLYLAQHGSTMVPLELTCLNANTASLQSSAFERFQAPLSLLLSHMGSQEKSIALYLAQCSLGDLPSDLQADLPKPSLIERLGRGDIYGSSLWMGRPPTRTPLHRDPNPNLFVQLAGRKVIRLMKPDDGKKLYDSLTVGEGHANMRGEEMMAGREMQALESAVWDKSGTLSGDANGVEATLDSGDALYIPLGWWHAVHGTGSGANASVNWWFR